MIPGLAWIITQSAKILIEKRWKYVEVWTDLFKSGGMPSAHSSFVLALTTAIGLKEGIYSSLFALSLSFSAIVVYDAMHVRNEAGKHATVLNQIFKEHKITDLEIKKMFPLENSIGHTPLQAMIGALCGIILGLGFFYL